MRAATCNPADKTIETLQRRGYLHPPLTAERGGVVLQQAQLTDALQDHAEWPPEFIVMPTYQCKPGGGPYLLSGSHADGSGVTATCLGAPWQPEMVDRIYKGMLQIEAAHGITDSPTRPAASRCSAASPLLADKAVPSSDNLIAKGRESAAGPRSRRSPMATDSRGLPRSCSGPEKPGASSRSRSTVRQINTNRRAGFHGRRASGNVSIGSRRTWTMAASSSGFGSGLRMERGPPEHRRLAGAGGAVHPSAGWTKHRRFRRLRSPRFHASSDNTDAQDDVQHVAS